MEEEWNNGQNRGNRIRSKICMSPQPWIYLQSLGRYSNIGHEGEMIQVQRNHTIENIVRGKATRKNVMNSGMDFFISFHFTSSVGRVVSCPDIEIIPLNHETRIQLQFKISHHSIGLHWIEFYQIGFYRIGYYWTIATFTLQREMQDADR